MLVSRTGLTVSSEVLGLLEKGLGCQLLLSRTAVSEITERLWAEYEAFASRDLSEFELVYLFVDGIAERLHLGQPREAVLAAWGILADGKKALLHLAPGSKEDTASCREFFQDNGPPGGHRPGCDGIGPCQASARTKVPQTSRADRAAECRLRAMLCAELATTAKTRQLEAPRRAPAGPRQDDRIGPCLPSARLRRSAV
jgi:hypothetical protein